MRKILALLVAFCAFFAFGLQPAQATNRFKAASCGTGHGSGNNVTANVYYTIYTDGGGNQRASMSLDSGHTRVSDAFGATLDYNISFNSDSGTAWGTGNVTGSNPTTVYPSSAANGRTIYNPYALVAGGMNNDGYPMCWMTVYLTA